MKWDSIVTGWVLTLGSLSVRNGFAKTFCLYRSTRQKKHVLLQVHSSRVTCRDTTLAAYRALGLTLDAWVFACFAVQYWDDIS